MGNLPNVAAGIHEASGSYSPRPIHRAVQQLHSASGQLAPIASTSSTSMVN
jgi:hypothetical protein